MLLRETITVKIIKTMQSYIRGKPVAVQQFKNLIPFLLAIFLERRNLLFLEYMHNVEIMIFLFMVSSNGLIKSVQLSSKYFYFKVIPNGLVESCNSGFLNDTILNLELGLIPVLVNNQ